MKVLWSWLLELCDLDRQPTAEEDARALTRGGLEIEGMTNLGAGFTGVVVAEVVARRPHPQAEKLTLVDVITGRGGAATQGGGGAGNAPPPGRRAPRAPGGGRPGGGGRGEPPGPRGAGGGGLRWARRGGPRTPPRSRSAQSRSR